MISVPVTSEVLQVPAAARHRVWVGHHLKVVRYSLDNVSLSARMVRESDFWQPTCRHVQYPGGPADCRWSQRSGSTTSDEGEALMANFNTLIKRKQYIWLGLILAGGAVGGGLYLSDLNMSSDEEARLRGEPAPDMTGVVDSSFNSKVEQRDNRNAGDCR
ncbi:hypothetical protein BANRA_05199 [Klebsiella pneumoniae]|nr:hypothetical protein BANRA_05199 [Klebsiella pneumoniae]